jgi:hypothetical protein
VQIQLQAQAQLHVALSVPILSACPSLGSRKKEINSTQYEMRLGKQDSVFMTTTLFK